MPRRTDLKRVLVLGAGPIVIGQGCEFDYSGTQGIRALRAEGYEVVLVNSNPATIMTDPELADRTYVEPLDLRAARAIVEKERPSAILPTLGGQTALNLALGLEDDGTLARLGIELLGARPESIRKAEDRALFKAAMERIGLECPRAVVARSLDEARVALREFGLPLILRPSFTLGGTGGGIVRTESELEAKVALALTESPTHEVLVEESLLGWKEFELEVIRDRKDNFIVVCTIENLDPLGVHTGDSITVAPAMTLTDKEYQRLRDAARAVMSEIGVETGGANVQFAVRPHDGAMRVIEMNPRVSRSSALASKATGYPIAKIATKLAIGYSLDELTNDLTSTSAAFEPTLDYVVVKWPRFAFDKFPGADDTLGTQMKSVGETMAIGRTFAEAVQKAARGLETGLDGLSPGSNETDVKRILEIAARPNDRRLLYVVDALRAGAKHEDVALATAIDPWFIAQLQRIVDAERAAQAGGEAGLADAGSMLHYKRVGLSDARLAKLVGSTEDAVRSIREQRRREADVLPRRHLRGGDARHHAVPLRHVGGRERRRSAGPRQAEGRRARRGPQPDRPGHRVRLLLRPCGGGRARARVRGHHGQLEPGDGLHRLRHRRPPLLRADHARDGARNSATSRSRTASSSSSAGRRRSVSRTRSPREASTSSGRAPTRSIAPRTADASTRCWRSSGSSVPRARSPRRATRSTPPPSGSAGRCSSVRATCSADGR